MIPPLSILLFISSISILFLLSSKDGVLKFHPKTKFSVENHNIFKVEPESKPLNFIISSKTAVAIGLAVTSNGVFNVTQENLRYKFPFFRSLLPSFCKTSTQGYSYTFYVAYDQKDSFFRDPDRVFAFKGEKCLLKLSQYCVRFSWIQVYLISVIRNFQVFSHRNLLLCYGNEFATYTMWSRSQACMGAEWRHDGSIPRSCRLLLQGNHMTT